MVRLELEKHEYFDDNKVQYVATSNVISAFKSRPFDAHKMSSYKAIKDVFKQYGIWDRLYKEAGKWDNVVNLFRAKRKAGIYKNNPELIKYVLSRKQYWLNEWKENAQEGTDFHDYMEQTTNNSGKVTIEHKKHDSDKIISTGLPVYEGRDVDIATIPYDTKGVYTEVVIYNNKYFPIAGTIDRMEKHGVIVDLADYKTNKKLDRRAFRYTRMLYPLTELQDCNFSHYTLQLCIYAWMLEQAGYKIRNLTIEHILRDKWGRLTNDFIPYSIDYRPELVEKLLKVYASKYYKK